MRLKHPRQKIVTHWNEKPGNVRTVLSESSLISWSNTWKKPRNWFSVKPVRQWTSELCTEQVPHSSWAWKTGAAVTTPWAHPAWESCGEPEMCDPHKGPWLDYCWLLSSSLLPSMGWLRHRAGSARLYTCTGFQTGKKQPSRCSVLPDCLLAPHAVSF